MFGKIINGKVEYAPSCYTKPNGSIITGFNTNEVLMRKYGFKLLIEDKPVYDDNTEYLSIYNINQSDTEINVVYEVKKKYDYHYHANEKLLDGINDSKVSKWNDKYDDVELDGTVLNFKANGSIKKTVSLPQMNEDGEVNIDLTPYQRKHDDSLQTINKSMIGAINEINRNFTYINPDNFNGTDCQKIQTSINHVIINKLDADIVLSREYILKQNEVIYIDKEESDQTIINITGNGGGIKKEHSGFIFASHNYSADYVYVGDMRLKNLRIRSKDSVGTILFDANSLIRCYMFDCDIYNLDCILKADNYSQSFYILRNKIRYGNGILFDTENNYDLNISDNLIEWCKDVFCFSGANGCRVTNNLIEGIKGYVVYAKAKSGCQSLCFDNNYFELNASYFDLTNLKGYGFSLKNSFVHDTDSNKSFVKLPINAYGGNPHQDMYLFESNVCSGVIRMFEFTSKPNDIVRIISISNNSNSRNYNENITYYGTTFSRTNAQGSKIYQKGESVAITKSIYKEFTTSKDMKPIVIEIDIGEMLSYYDQVNVQCMGSGGYDSYESTSCVSILNSVVKNEHGKIKIVVGSNESYYGTVGVTFYVSVLKTPFTQWF